MEEFINTKLSGNKTNSRGFYTNEIFNENKLNEQLKIDFIRKWDDIEIDNFKITSDQKTRLKNNNNENKKAEISKYILELVNKKLNDFLSSFTNNEELLKKYRINIKLFLQQSSQVEVYLNILNILKIHAESIIFLNSSFNKVKSKIYKSNNSILSKNIYEYNILTAESKINIGNAKFIYYCNHTKNKLKETIKFNWKTENIRNFMNMIMNNNIDENIMNKLYEKIFCKEQTTNIAGQEQCSSLYDTIKDIDNQFKYYYNLLKNKNLMQITEENLMQITEENLKPGKISFQLIVKFITLCKIALSG